MAKKVSFAGSTRNPKLTSASKSRPKPTRSGVHASPPAPPRRSDEPDSNVLVERKIQQKQLVTELQASASHLRALLESAGEAIITVQANGQIGLANKAAERMFGYGREELVGQPVEVLIPERLRKSHRKYREHFSMQPESRPMGARGMELLGRRKDGSEFPIETSLSSFYFKDEVRTAALVTDITLRKQAEADLNLSHQRLRDLSARLLTSTEDQKKELGRELHDSFGQKLALLGLRIHEAESLLPTRPDQAAEKLRFCREQVEVLAQEIHDLSRHLHPHILSELGLVVALRSECETHARQAGTAVEFSAENVPEALAEDVGLCLYRLAQESLQNIWKHAESNRVAVTVRATTEEIELIVEDFGKGFDIASAKAKGGLGLISMQERVRIVGGSLVITTTAGNGTRVHARIPLERD